MTDEDLAKYMDAIASMGRSARFSMRRILRQAGETIEPGVIVYTGGVRSERAQASLGWLPGEEEWNRERDATANKGRDRHVGGDPGR